MRGKFASSPNSDSIKFAFLCAAFTVTLTGTCLTATSVAEAFSNPFARMCRSANGTLQSLFESQVPICEWGPFRMDTLSLMNEVDANTSQPKNSTRSPSSLAVEAIKNAASQGPKSCSDFPLTRLQIVSERSDRSAVVPSDRVCEFSDGSMVSESLFGANQTATQFRNDLLNLLSRLTGY